MYVTASCRPVGHHTVSLGRAFTGLRLDIIANFFFWRIVGEDLRQSVRMHYPRIFLIVILYAASVAPRSARLRVHERVVATHVGTQAESKLYTQILAHQSAQRMLMSTTVRSLSHVTMLSDGLKSELKKLDQECDPTLSNCGAERSSKMQYRKRPVSTPTAQKETKPEVVWTAPAQTTEPKDAAEVVPIAESSSAKLQNMNCNTNLGWHFPNVPCCIDCEDNLCLKVRCENASFAMDIVTTLRQAWKEPEIEKPSINAAVVLRRIDPNSGLYSSDAEKWMNDKRFNNTLMVVKSENQDALDTMAQQHRRFVSSHSKASDARRFMFINWYLRLKPYNIKPVFYAAEKGKRPDGLGRPFAMSEYTDWKKCAVVGRSPRLEGAALGRAIDAHDFVLRTNGGWEIPPNKVTDLGSFSNATYINQVPGEPTWAYAEKYASPELLIISYDPNHEEYRRKSRFRTPPKRRVLQLNPDLMSKIYADFRGTVMGDKTLNHCMPSAGYSAVMTAILTCSQLPVDLFGFGYANVGDSAHQNDKSAVLQSDFGPCPPGKSSHDMAMELLMYEDMQRGGLVRLW